MCWGLQQGGGKGRSLLSTEHSELDQAEETAKPQAGSGTEIGCDSDGVTHAGGTGCKVWPLPPTNPSVLAITLVVSCMYVVVSCHDVPWSDVLS